MIRWLKRLVGGRNVTPTADRAFEVRHFTPAELREFAIEGAMSAGASRANAERFVAHLTGERPMSEQERIRMILDHERPIVTDWDIAQAPEQRETEPGRVAYQFLGVTGEEDA